MTLPNRYDLTIRAGETLKRWWRLRYSNGSVVNLGTVGATATTVTIATTQQGGGGPNEVQTVTLNNSPTYGTFTLTYSGQTTAAIPYNATAAQVDAALEALSNIGAGDVTCTGGPLPTTPVTVTFTGALANTNVAEMTATSSLYTGGYTIGRLTVRDEYGGTAQLELTTANGGVSLTYQADADGAFWSGYLYASATTTTALTEWGDGVYDFEISNGVDVLRVMEGVAVLSPESTT